MTSPRMTALLLLIAVLLASSPAQAQPCPPKHYYCWQVKLAAASFGAAALEAQARACGWSELQIAIARRCLK